MAARYTDAFKAWLDCFSLESLETSHCPIFGIDQQFRLVYFNPAFEAFYPEKISPSVMPKRPELGEPVFEAFYGANAAPFEKIFAGALESGKPHSFEAEFFSSPEPAKYYHGLYPFRNGKAIITVNSQLVGPGSEVKGKPPLPLDVKNYTNPETGLLNLCSYCRRAQRISDDEKWDLVPVWVTDMPMNASHTLCPLCYEYYYASLYGRPE